VLGNFEIGKTMVLRWSQSNLEIGNAFRVHFSQRMPFGPCE
jgi:hypothetical protein